MKNYLFFLAGLTLVIFNGCKEIGPAIDFSSVAASDTTYLLTTPETPEPRRVLVEEYTGIQCTNCPDAATLLEQAQTANAGREIIIVGLHGGAQTDPIPGESKYVLQSSLAQNLVSSYFGETPPKPAAAIDRVKRDDAYFNISRTQWAGNISDRLALATPVKLSVTSNYKETTKEAIITVRASFTDDVTKRQSLSVFITEDKIIDLQEYTDHKDFFYEHNHVFRDMLTPISGSSVLDSFAVKQKGRVYERTFVYPVNSEWKVDNLNIVAVIHNNETGGDKEVTQVKEVPLK